MADGDMADQILMAQETIHCIEKKVRGSNMVIKLDMAKAFDKLSWSYLTEILNRFGFSSQFIHLVMNNLRSTCLSIITNGKPQGFFKPKRGVKQGGPLISLHIYNASEGFFRGLNWLMDTGKMKPY
ncbi:unnamed protein product [Cuscuta europaea]|uniref:Reverse transcriptase domain-containing protein n=1 Tax=Cuscuta europaea TaxID=41803 RepID=A0A9P0Z7Q6_CUSEU|nr:unnamed protein product [Cuscuta europaea]